MALQHLPVVFAVDRAGLVGEDGETHQGVYDLAYLHTIPELDIYAPSSQEELAAVMAMALAADRPAAVRYPRGALMNRPLEGPMERGRWETLRPLRPISLVAEGPMVERALLAGEGKDVGVINAWCIRPMDLNMLETIKGHCKQILCLEDGLQTGGLGSRLCEALSGTGVRVARLGVGETPVAQGTASQQYAWCGLDVDSIRRQLENMEEKR